MDDWQKLSDFCDSRAKRAVIQRFKGQREVGDSGTPHIQFFMQLRTKKRLAGAAEALATILGHKRSHLEGKRGSVQQCNDYCSKEDTRMAGTQPISFGFPRELVEVTKIMLRPWQLAIAERHDKFADNWDRKIWWYWEAEGGHGKTTLIKYFMDQRNALMVGGAGKDVAFAISKHIEKHLEGPEVVCYDIPRCSQKYFSWAALEQVKNGCIFSPKYESTALRFNTPHVLVFSNAPPDDEDWELLTKDRWEVWNVLTGVRTEAPAFNPEPKQRYGERYESGIQYKRVNVNVNRRH